jgi:hypothetical protein
LLTEIGADAFGSNIAMAVLTKTRTIHRTWIYFVMNDSSVSTSKLAEAAAVQLTMNTLAAQDIISRFPRVPENMVDHATEAPKNFVLTQTLFRNHENCKIR